METSVAPSFWRQTTACIGALILREMSSNYGRAPGGYIWAVLEPLAGIILMTLMFSLIFSHPPLGESFALFYASGMIPFSIYRDLSNKVGKCKGFASHLLSYPSVTFMDAILARVLLNSMTQILVAILLIGGICLASPAPVQFDPSALALALICVVSLSLGLGIFNAWLFDKLPVWEQLWNIANRPMFLLSTVFYLFETTPDTFRDLLWFNPLVHIVGLVRRGLYPTYEASFASPAYVFAIGLVFMALGLLMLRRHQMEK